VFFDVFSNKPQKQLILNVLQTTASKQWQVSQKGRLVPTHAGTCIRNRTPCTLVAAEHVARAIDPGYW